MLTQEIQPKGNNMSNTDLAIIDIKNPLQLFTTPKGLDAVIDKIEAEVKTIDRDISTEAGRANVRSLAFKLAKSKNALDKMGKDLTDEQRAIVNAVNEERRRAWDRMEALQEEIRKPLTDWENAEKDRVAAHETGIKYLETADQWEHPATIEIVNKRLADFTPFYEGRDWQEFRSRADTLYANGLAALNARLAQLVKAEEEAAEFARLRAAEQDRLQKEHEAKIAEEAAKAATLEAERKAAQEAAAVEAARKAEQEAAAQREREAAAALKKAESERLAAEKAAKEAQEKAELDQIAAAKKAKADQDAAVEAERQRVASEQEAERKMAQAREADKSHKAKIHNEVKAAILKAGAILDAEERAQAITIAIAKGQIPHVKIIY